MRSQEMIVIVVLSATLGAAPAGAQDWTVKWEGVDRPGPVNLPFDDSGVCLNFICQGGPRDGELCLSGSTDECVIGWPLDPAGFEQHDPDLCYADPGPYFAELANVDTGGCFSIMNVVDAGCMGIKRPDDPECAHGPRGWDLTDNPCGMRYQVGPRTLHHPFGLNTSGELTHYQSSFGFNPPGMTAEISFYIEQSPTSVWTDILRMRGYVKNQSPGADPEDSSEVRVMLRHFMEGRPQNEWHLVVSNGNFLNVKDLGKVEDLVGRWHTIRVGLGNFMLKQQKIAWFNGQWVVNDPVGWRDISPGSGGSDVNGYVQFGYNETDGDIRLGTMAFSNQGLFSPTPGGECHLIFENYYFPYLPTVAKTQVSPEVCDNGTDDDGDGRNDCDDPDCWQEAPCNNLLVNGSFEQEQVGSTSCPVLPNTNKPADWFVQPGDQGTFLANSTIWIPPTLATHGFARGSIDKGSSSGGPNRVFQTVDVLPGPVTLRGFITGEGFQYKIFAELLDGDLNSSTVLDRFEIVGDNVDSSPPFEEFEISGTATGGKVTVRWGLDGATHALVRAAHVDNLYLTATTPAPCNVPFADADGDGDVDQDDFGEMQKCFTGAGNLSTDPLCGCFDVEGPGGGKDGDIDQGDVLQFENCATGSEIPFVAANHPNCNS